MNSIHSNISFSVLLILRTNSFSPFSCRALQYTVRYSSPIQVRRWLSKFVHPPFLDLLLPHFLHLQAWGLISLKKYRQICLLTAGPCLVVMVAAVEGMMAGCFWVCIFSREMRAINHNKNRLEWNLYFKTRGVTHMKCSFYIHLIIHIGQDFKKNRFK